MDEKLIKKEPLGNGCFVYVSPRHTFGTDAVLLADFAAARKDDRLVDLGTGCGIIPFLILRNGARKSAVGVEISSEAAALAKRTESELKTGKFTALNADLKDLKGRIEFGCHTLVTCNPPYKAPGAGLKNPDSIKAAARHETECTLRDIIEVSSRLLQTSGRLCMCHRPERLAELISLMREFKTEPKRLRLVCQREGEEPWLVLIEGRKCSNTGLRIMPPLYIEKNGALSPDMEKIYGAYKEAYMN